jgi:hypothetical protein
MRVSVGKRQLAIGFPSGRFDSALHANPVKQRFGRQVGSKDPRNTLIGESDVRLDYWFDSEISLSRFGNSECIACVRCSSAKKQRGRYPREILFNTV